MSNTVMTTNQTTTERYKEYSKFYPIQALAAYWIVWQGKIFKHIQFFSDLYTRGDEILDIATGDGSLTKAALFSKGRRPKKLIALDLSEDMLGLAKQKLPPTTEFVVGDVMNLPYAANSVRTMACFGGLNSFPSMQGALEEMARVLHPEGYLRGSILLMPKEQWRRNLVLKWIEQGFQTEVITEEKFFSGLAEAGFLLTQLERHGDVFLFEVRKIRQA